MAPEIRTSLRPERPGTTPEGNVRQRESKERKGERESRKQAEQKKARETKEQRPMTRKDRRTQHTSKQEREKKERSINGGGKVVTPSVRSRRQRGVEQAV